jgi:ATP-binding cassette subfamily B protein
MADSIYVMDHGRIVEHGTHAALLAADGRDARLHRAQARRDKDK